MCVCCAQDQTGQTPPSLSSTGTTVVTILDLNEVPVFQHNPYTVSVNENVPVNTLVGAPVTAWDQDLADCYGALRMQCVVACVWCDFGCAGRAYCATHPRAPRHHTRCAGTCPGSVSVCSQYATCPPAALTACTCLNYVVSSGNTNGAFSIGVTSGQIYVARAIIDFEKIPTYQLSVTVVDHGGLTAVATVTVNIGDVNDPPYFGTISTLSIVENSPMGTPVGSPLPWSDEDTLDSHGDVDTCAITAQSPTSMSLIAPGGL
jgi:hypothetical protein